jgi:hypothetical protein
LRRKDRDDGELKEKEDDEEREHCSDGGCDTFGVLS